MSDLPVQTSSRFVFIPTSIIPNIPPQPKRKVSSVRHYYIITYAMTLIKTSLFYNQQRWMWKTPSNETVTGHERAAAPTPAWRPPPPVPDQPQTGPPQFINVTQHESLSPPEVLAWRSRHHMGTDGNKRVLQGRRWPVWADSCLCPAWQDEGDSDVEKPTTAARNNQQVDMRDARAFDWR